MFKPLATALLLGVIGGPAVAATCNGTTQMGMDACASNDYQKADGQLNADYKQVLKLIGDDAASREKFVASQRAWLKFRDTHCDFVGSATEGGSIHSMIVGQCLATLTQDRVKQLKAFTDCQEGDMSCPVPAPE